MSSRRNRKRRRSQAFPVEDGDEGHSISTHDLKDEDDLRQSNDDNLNGDEQSKKELEIWDAFREENYEAIEQLPLSLHRQYMLLHELDEQAEGYTKDLKVTIKEYTTLRKSLGSRQQVAAAEQNVLKSEPPPTPINRLAALHDSRTPLAMTPNPLRQSSYFATRMSTPMSLPPDRVKRPQTTREMLSHAAWLSEEIQRAADEKVNLAQAAYDSVGRHIRLLDQAIKEQEANIALGVRPGTHLAPILLPDLVVPGSRPARAQSPAQEDDGDGGMTLGILGADEGTTQPQRRGRAGTKSRGKPAREEVAMDVDVPAGRRLKLKGPVIAEPQAVVPDEERYCYCNQVSFGEMVACDNEMCEREWFHLGCASLTNSPADDEAWFCRDCQHLTKGNKRPKTRQRKKR